MSAPTITPAHLCDPETKMVAYVICAEIHGRAGCICQRNDNGPCESMILAACAAERKITEQREARG